MMTNNFDKILGKKIDSVLFLGAFKKIDTNTYLIDTTKVTFFNKDISKVLVLTNKDENIDLVYVIFKEKFNTSTYKELIKVYGNDYDVFLNKKLDSSISYSIRKENEFEEEIKQESSILEKGNIHDSNIHNIIWNKDSLSITLFNNYLENRTEIHFKKK